MINLNIELNSKDRINYPIIIGSSILAEISEFFLKFSSKKVVIVTNETIFELYEEKFPEMFAKTNLHIEYLCESQITDVGLYVLLLRMINDHKKMKMSVYERIENLCLKKGVSTHLKGFDYLQSAILFYMENDRDCFRMKDVYDTIAKKHHTTSSRVEKNMRLAINASGSELSNAKFVDECFRECQYE